VLLADGSIMSHQKEKFVSMGFKNNSGKRIACESWYRVALATSSRKVGIIDRRTGLIEEVLPQHSNTIGMLQFGTHDELLTADSKINIWDLRFLQQPVAQHCDNTRGAIINISRNHHWFSTTTIEGRVMIESEEIFGRASHQVGNLSGLMNEDLLLTRNGYLETYALSY